MIKQILTIMLTAILIAGCTKGKSPRKYNNTGDIERAIRCGELGEEFAQRARKVENLYVREIIDADIPYKIYSFSDYKSGYSILAYEGKLILLCEGFGGGYARDIKIQSLNGKKVITYKFNVGSGRSYELSGEYVLGSDKATWQNLNDIKP